VIGCLPRLAGVLARLSARGVPEAFGYELLALAVYSLLVGRALVVAF
jgi:hypothetical protein